MKFWLILLISVQAAFAEGLKSQLHDQMRSDHRVSLSYKEARKKLFGMLHLKRDIWGVYVEDVYCQKKYRKSDGVGVGQIPNHQQINCEHTWPKSRFNKERPYNFQLTDLHHLYPSNSRANSVRSNNYFANVSDPQAAHDSCYPSSKGPIPGEGMRGFEPPSEHKGNVARALFYFSIRYQISIPEHEERYLRVWHEQDPVDDEESLRNAEIAKIQGNRNAFIDNPEYVDEIADF
jgi:deoxyribonuclease-1